MDDADKNLRREIQELKAEVRRLKRMIESGVLIVCLIALVIFPQLLILAAYVAGLILFAFLVSPVRGLIFSYIFRRDIR